MNFIKFASLKTLFFVSFFIYSPLFAGGFDNAILLKGTVLDKDSKEALIGATVYIEEFKTGTATDINGVFHIKLSSGTYNLTISYIGYKSNTEQITIDQSKSQTFYLEKETQQIEDVVVMGERSDINITRMDMSVEKMKIKTIRQIPALMGEVDIIKAIQLLPGVQSTSEGSSGFSVRGGNMDQNLILLDDAPVYNASHFLGFFSVFNNDAIKEIELYKGDMPVAYGGRLSSLLDIKVSEGNTEKWEGSAGIGPISTRFSADGPIINDKTSLFVAGRLFNAQFYLYALQNFEDDLKGVQLYFYDVNAKLTHRIDIKNTLTANFYNGRDAFNQEGFKFGFGNTAATVSWIHRYNENIASKFSLIHSKYDYNFSIKFDAATGMLWNSNISDYGFRLDNTILLDNENTIKFGFSSIYHNFYPGIIEPIGTDSTFSKYELAPNSAIEWGIYGSNVQEITDKLTLKYGMRFSVFQNVGSGTVYNYDANYEVIDSSTHKAGDVYNVYQGLEPRFGAVYQLNDISSIKASYSRTRQYIHMASNSTGGTAFDIWVASNPNIKPQVADQVAVGYFRNFWFNQLEASAELYYKKMNNNIDFKDHAEIILNRHIDGELRTGDAYSYGAEFQLKYNLEKLNGWISYTLSKSQRDIPLVNAGKVYNSPYDKPNDIAIVGSYQINDKWSVSANWVYASGTPMTIPSGFYEIENVMQIYYKEGDRNKVRMPDYHRLDIGITRKSRVKEGKRIKSEWNFSLYNAYGRKNPWAINFVRDEKTKEIKAEMTYLFTYVPSITYNITF
ncbi:MAG: TonB-dependent receptor [Salinivirgaceae bacterium]|nr:TonB-dependent receptor [Salinivirgaceae bacterium]